MHRRILVFCIGPALTIRGGPSRVIRKVKDRFPENIDFRIVPTFSEYCGSAELQRGSRIVQIGVFARAFIRILWVALFNRSALFQVHLSQKGSTLRKGSICIALRLLQSKYVVHTHAAEPESMFHPWVPAPARAMLLWGLRGAFRFATLTHAWSEYYLRTVNLPPQKLVLLPNPADLPPAIPDRTGRVGFTVLFLGRVGHRKGAFDSIRAFANLPETVRRQTRLLIAGDGETGKAEDLARELGCCREVSILGWVGDSEVERLLGEADALVLPSHGEGMSIALLEAMGWGLAIVTTDAGGTTEFLEANRDCLLVSPGDIDGITAALSALAKDPGMRLRLGSEARRVAMRFGIDQYVTQLVALWEDLAAWERI